MLRTRASEPAGRRYLWNRAGWSDRRFGSSLLYLCGSNVKSSQRETVPQNVPQQCAIQALRARYALHARIFLLSDFVSIENKECLIYFPKLDVAGSIPVARSIFLSKFLAPNSKATQTLETSPKTSPTGSRVWVAGNVRFQK
jgi:hypothetical protein